MSYFLDVPKSELDRIREIIKIGPYSSSSGTFTTSFESYSHNDRYQRFEFENEATRNGIKNALRRRGIEALPLDAKWTSANSLK